MCSQVKKKVSIIGKQYVSTKIFNTVMYYRKYFMLE
jgi:hypothetical protein